MKFFLSIIAIFKNEGYVLEEWIKHHIWQGVEHFYLINNDSTDNYLEILQPYIDAEIVTLFNLSGQYKQVEYYNTVFQYVKNDTTWLMVIDIDEFYYCTIKPLKDFLQNDIEDKYNNITNVWKIFGSSGHINQPKNIRESFTHRVRNPYSLYHENANLHKYIIKTKDTKELACHDPVPINGYWRKLLNNKYLKLNHYQIMSQEYYQKIKMTRGAADIPEHQNIRDMYYFHQRNMNNILDYELRDLIFNNYYTKPVSTLTINDINNIYGNSIKYNNIINTINHNINGRVCHNRVVLLNILVEYLQIDRYLEIGVHNGASMSYVIFNQKKSIDCYGIDLFESTFGHYKKDHITYNQSMENITKNNNSHSLITLIKGNSYDDKTFKNIQNILNDKTIDLLFIDGDHSYQGIMSDFNKYTSFLRPGGYVVLDDYHRLWPDIVKFVDTNIDYTVYKKIGNFLNTEVILQKIS